MGGIEKAKEIEIERERESGLIVKLNTEIVVASKVKFQNTGSGVFAPRCL